MPYDVKLPDIGEGIAEGEIVRWLVKLGDSVREDQPLVEVMTDKANVEIPSPRTGVVTAVLAEEGQVVPVGTVIISIGTQDEVDRSSDSAGRSGGSLGASEASAAGAHGGTSASADSRIAASPGATSGRVQATPAVRQLAKQLGVALEGIRGTGPGGAVTAADVRGAAQPRGAETTSTLTAAPAAAAPASGSEERIPLRGLRRRIAEHMKRSITTAAHYTFVAECDMTAVVEHRGRLKQRAEKAGIKLTYLAYVIKGLIEPLRQFPMLNATLDDERGEIVLKRYYHVGIATHTPEGLTVPVLRDADRRSLFVIARELQLLAEAARNSRLKLDELQGGTFTVTSTGAHGGVLATPILHHPQVAILGVHEIKKRPAVVGDQIVARDLCNLSLSLDHRVVDGAVGADFLYALVQRLEYPGEWLTESEIE